jgi:hypothetical protein
MGIRAVGTLLSLIARGSLIAVIAAVLLFRLVRQLERIVAVIVWASFAVLGPRSFSYTIPSRVSTKVMTPEDWYSSGYATKVKPPFFFPWPLTSPAQDLFLGVLESSVETIL